jgi:N-acetylmuramoyl-L-alanine amidase
VGIKPTEESKELGLKLSAAMAKTLDIKDRGLVSRDVSIVSGARQVGVPCFVLTESCFIDAATDLNKTRENTLKSAKAIADTVSDFFSL